MRKTHKMGDGVVRVETLHARSDDTTNEGRTPTTPSEDGRMADHGIPTSEAMISEPARYLAFYKSSEASHRRE